MNVECLVLMRGCTSTAKDETLPAAVWRIRISELGGAGRRSTRLVQFWLVSAGKEGIESPERRHAPFALKTRPIVMRTGTAKTRHAGTIFIRADSCSFVVKSQD